MIKIFDGPGLLCDQVVADPVSKNRFYLSSYQGYIKYFRAVSTRYDIKIAYQIILSHSAVRSQDLNWTSIDHLEDSTDCVHHQNTTQFRSTTGRCWPRHHFSYFTIHRMMFNGFNMLLHTSTAQSTTCGLFIFSRSKFGTLTDLYSICSNITRESVLPFEHYHTFGMLMIFVTFEGYSSGSLDLSITKEQECSGLNYLYSYPILDIPQASTGDPIDYDADKAESTMCMDVF